MTDSRDYRLFLDERFKGLTTHITDQFNSVNERLDGIKDDTTRTNSRVNHLEDDVDDLKNKFVKHPLECSKSKEIDALKEDLIEYKFMKKYPKLTAIIIALFAIGILISAYGTFSTIHNNIRTRATEQVINKIETNTDIK